MFWDRLFHREGGNPGGSGKGGDPNLVGRPFGRVLTKMGKVTREQVVEALNLQKSKGGGIRIGEALVQLGYISMDDVLAALAAQRGGDDDSTG